MLTHAHFDHIGALKNLRAATNARVYIGEADKDDPSHMCHDLLTYTDTYQDGDTVAAGGLTFQVLSTYIYRISLGGGTSFELSTAINLVLQVLGLIVVLITNKFVSKLDIMGIF